MKVNSYFPPVLFPQIYSFWTNVCLSGNFTSFNLGHHDKAVKLTEILFIIAEYVWCENGRNKSKSFYNIEQSFIDYIKNFPLNQIDLS